MLIRLIDYLKSRADDCHVHAPELGGVAGSALENTDVGVSSLIDTWILLRDIELGGERNKGLYILKSRGMKHSNQIREYLLTPEGIQLQDVYIGPEGVLTGSMRAAQEARERAEHTERIEAAERKSATSSVSASRWRRRSLPCAPSSRRPRRKRRGSRRNMKDASA